MVGLIAIVFCQIKINYLLLYSTGFLLSLRSIIDDLVSFLLMGGDQATISLGAINNITLHDGYGLLYSLPK